MWQYEKNTIKTKPKDTSECGWLSGLTPGASTVSNDLWERTNALTKVWMRNTEISPLPQHLQGLPKNPERTFLGATLLKGIGTKSPSPHQQWDSGVEWLPATRLTCSTVGICIPGFLVKHQGALWSNHPDECRNFAVKRGTVNIFSIVPSLFCWHLLGYLKEYCHQRWLCSKFHEPMFKIVRNRFQFHPKVIKWKINVKTTWLKTFSCIQDVTGKKRNNFVFGFCSTPLKWNLRVNWGYSDCACGEITLIV